MLDSLCTWFSLRGVGAGAGGGAGGAGGAGARGGGGGGGGGPRKKLNDHRACNIEKRGGWGRSDTT